MGVRDRIAVALDTSSLDEALEITKAVQPYVGIAKVGLQLFSASGHAAVKAVQDTGIDVFLDVKLHDIPNTVYGASSALGALGVRYLTVHASGGQSMLEAAVKGLAEGAARVGLTPPTALAITVLTSDPEASPELLLKRVEVAEAAGCGGIVCAAPDLDVIRMTARRIIKVVPGIRPVGADLNDQSRVATPRSAIEGGADILVIGRPITRADNPAEAAEAIFEEVSYALDSSDA